MIRAHARNNPPSGGASSPPQIVSVTLTSFMSSTDAAIVVFDQDVTYAQSGLYPDVMTIGGSPGAWQSQFDSKTMFWADDASTDHSSGEAWELTATDELTPAPALPQSGVVA